MDELQPLEAWAEPLLASLSPAARSRLARRIGTALRKSQGDRIGRQAAPDGSPFTPRKEHARDKKGRIKRHAMFAKMRQARHLKVRTNPNEVAVGFFGRVARIAQVHQDGLVDAVRPGGPRVRYEQRALLGFSAGDQTMIRDLLLDHLDTV